MAALNGMLLGLGYDNSNGAIGLLVNFTAFAKKDEWKKVENALAETTKENNTDPSYSLLSSY